MIHRGRVGTNETDNGTTARPLRASALLTVTLLALADNDFPMEMSGLIQANREQQSANQRSLRAVWRSNEEIPFFCPTSLFLRT